MKTTAAGRIFSSAPAKYLKGRIQLAVLLNNSHHGRDKSVPAG
jgi:hypothetical protein